MTHTLLQSWLVKFSFNLERGDIFLWRRYICQSFLVSLSPHTIDFLTEKKKGIFFEKLSHIVQRDAQRPVPASLMVTLTHPGRSLHFKLQKTFIWIKSIEGSPSQQMMLVLLA